MLNNFFDMCDYKISAIDGVVGKVEDLLFDDVDWGVRYLVVDTSDDLEVHKKLLVSPISVDSVNNEREIISLNLTKNSVDKSPDASEHEPVSRFYEKEFFKFYGYAYYWMGPGLWGTYTHPEPLFGNLDPIEEVSGEPEEPHLRSMNEIVHYALNGLDDSKGYVKDIVFNVNDWKVRFMVVNLRKWLPGGKEVAISVDKITEISWAQKSVNLILSKREIENSREFDKRATVFAK